MKKHIYIWILRCPSNCRFFGGYLYYGSNMPKPNTFSRKNAIWFNSKDDAEVFWYKKISKYPQHDFLRNYKIRRVKLFLKKKSKGSWFVDYWHKCNDN